MRAPAILIGHLSSGLRESALTVLTGEQDDAARVNWGNASEPPYISVQLRYCTDPAVDKTLMRIGS